jgi:conjugative relaxase-like TrwC/TraI family protein
MMSMCRLGADKGAAKGSGAEEALRYYQEMKAEARHDHEALGRYYKAQQKWLVIGEQQEASLVQDRSVVNDEDFLALARGKSPTGETLATERSKRSPGTDMTFNAPKGVSLFWAASDAETRAQIEAELHEASRAAIAYAVEEGWLFVRRGSGKRGKSVREPVAHVMAASFTHLISREGDPNLHQHTIVMQMARTKDGQWRSLDFKQVFDRQKLISAAFDNELAFRLREKFGLNFTANGKHAIDVAGVPKPLVKEMSKRSNQIAELDHDHGTQKARDYLALKTRQKKSELPDQEELEKRWAGQIRQHIPIDQLAKIAEIDQHRALETAQANALRADVQRHLANATVSGQVVLPHDTQQITRRSRLLDDIKAFVIRRAYHQAREPKLGASIVAPEQITMGRKTAPLHQNLDRLKRIAEDFSAWRTRLSARVVIAMGIQRAPESLPTDSIADNSQAKTAPVEQPTAPSPSPADNTAPIDTGVNRDDRTAQLISNWIARQATAERAANAEKAARPQEAGDYVAKDGADEHRAIATEARRILGNAETSPADHVLAVTLATELRRSSAIEADVLLERAYRLAAQDPALHWRTVKDAFQNFVQRPGIIRGEIEPTDTTIAKGRVAVTTDLILDRERLIRDVTVKGIGKTTDLSHRVAHQPGAEKLSEEQLAAVQQSAQGNQVSVLEGIAGVGKTTVAHLLLSTYEEAGYRSVLLTPTNKAAAKLAEETGREARSIQGFLYSSRAQKAITAKSLILIDEAAMCSTSDIAQVLRIARETGAIVRAMGDREQIQSPSGGSPLQIVAENVEIARISTVRRQEKEWMRKATEKMALRKSDEAMADYDEHGHVHFAENRDEAIAIAAQHFISQRAAGSSMAMSPTIQGVRDLNEAIRAQLIERTELGDILGVEKARQQISSDVSKDIIGDLEIRKGDRLKIGEKIDAIGVVTSDFATVVDRTKDGRYALKLDRDKPNAAPRLVPWSLLSQENWTEDQHGKTPKASDDRIAAPKVTHAWAVTGNGSQGETIDAAVGADLDGNMSGRNAYVIGSRHRRDLQFVVNGEAIKLRILAEERKTGDDPRELTDITTEEVKDAWLSQLRGARRNVNASDIRPELAETQKMEKTHDRPEHGQEPAQQLDGRPVRDATAETASERIERDGRSVRDASTPAEPATARDDVGTGPSDADSGRPGRNDGPAAEPSLSRGRDVRAGEAVAADPDADRHDRGPDGRVDETVGPGGRIGAPGIAAGDERRDQSADRQGGSAGIQTQPDPRAVEQPSVKGSITWTTPAGPASPTPRVPIATPAPAPIAKAPEPVRVPEPPPAPKPEAPKPAEAPKSTPKKRDAPVFMP